LTVAWNFLVGFSENGKRIVEQENILMTEDEAHDLKRCLTIALSSTNFITKNLVKNRNIKCLMYHVNEYWMNKSC
jgi:hypothetical protein